MAPPPYGQLEVSAAMTVSVDGATATVTGEGHRLIVESADPAALLEALAQAALPSGVGRVDGPRALGRLADGLHGAGLQVTVVGPRGPVLALGADSTSRLGLAATGSGHVRLGGWSSLRPLLAARLRRRRAGLAAVAGTAAAALLVAARVRRRRATGS